MAFQLVVSEFVRRLDAAGYDDLRPIHGLVFQAVQGGGTTVSELAEHLGVTKQAASQIASELEHKGYLARHPHPDGGRRQLLLLTDAGIRHMAVAGRILDDLERRLAREVGAAELVRLRDGLAQLVRALAGDRLPPLRPVW